MDLENQTQEEAIVKPYAGENQADEASSTQAAAEPKNPWITKYSYLIEKGEAAAKTRKMSPEEKWEMFSMTCPMVEVCATSFAVMDKKALSSFGKKLVKLKNADECEQFCRDQKAEFIAKYTSVEQLAGLIDCAWGDVELLIQIKKIVALNPSIQKGSGSSILDAVASKMAVKVTSRSDCKDETLEDSQHQNTNAADVTKETTLL